MEDLTVSWAEPWIEWIDHDRLVLRHNQSLQICSVSTFDQSLVSEEANAVAISQDRQIIFFAESSSGGDRIVTYDVETAAKNVVYQPEADCLCTALGISPDCSMISVSFYQADGILLVIWNVEKRCIVKSVSLTASLTDIAVCNSEEFTFSGIYDDGKIAVWSLKNQWDGIELRKQDIRMENKLSYVTAESWHEMGVIIGNEDGLLFLFAYKQPNGVSKLGKLTNGSPVTSISWHQDLLTAGGVGGVFYVARILTCDSNLVLEKMRQFEPGGMGTGKICVALRFPHNCAVLSPSVIKLVSNFDSYEDTDLAFQDLSFFDTSPKDTGMATTSLETSTTDIEEKAAEHSEEENLDDPLIQKLTKLTENLRRCKYSNSRASELEKMADEELVVDEELEDRYRRESTATVQHSEDAIKHLLQSLEDSRERIKKYCWDCYEIPDFAVSSLQNKELFVKNLPIEKQNENKKRLFRATIFKRKTDDMLRGIQTNVESNPSLDTQTLDSLEEVKSLLYREEELTTLGRKKEQMHLWSIFVRCIKERFNAKFQCFVNLKAKNMEKLSECNIRAREIVVLLNSFGKELEEKDYVLEPHYDSSLEDPEAVLKVNDEEVNSDKYVSQEELRKAQEAEAKRKEMANASERGTFGRGLKFMMNGSLDRPAEVDPDLTAERPDWMDTPPENLTEEEKKQMEVYETRLKAVAENRAKREAQLESELKSIGETQKEVVEEFDIALKELKKERNEALRSTQISELKIALLKKSTYEMSSSDKHREAALMEELSGCKEEATEVSKKMERLESSLVLQNNRWKKLISEAKQIDRTFLKEFPKGPTSHNELQKWFKWRGSLDEIDNKQQSRPVQFTTGEPNSANKKVEAQETELNLSDSIRPEGITGMAWVRMVQLRRERILLEEELKKEEWVLSSMQKQMEALQSQKACTEERIEDGVTKINQSKEAKQILVFDAEQVLEIEQGQIETVPHGLSRTPEEGLLLEKAVISQLNSVIREKGERKIVTLEQIKDFKKGIYMLQWENKDLDLKIEDAIERTKEIQLLRLDKETRHILSKGQSDASIKKKPKTAPKQQSSVRLNEKKVCEKQMVLAKMKQQTSKRQEENEYLSIQLEDFEVCGRGSDITPIQRKDQPVKKLEDLIADKKLQDFSLKQQREINELQKELELWYSRSFPRFSTRA